MILTGVDNHPEHAPNGVRGYGHAELRVAAAQADYLVLAIPGTKENENMIDRQGVIPLSELSRKG